MGIRDKYAMSSISNKYYRDTKWTKQVEGAGCSIISDVYSGGEQDDILELKVGLFFEIKECPISNEHGRQAYRYGFERANLHVLPAGVELLVDDRLQVVAPVQLSIEVSEEAAKKRIAGAKFSIGAALKGLIPWLTVEASAAVSAENSANKAETKSQKTQFTVYTLVPVSLDKWRLEAWDNPDGLLDGQTCGQNAALCKFREMSAAETKKVELVVTGRLADLRSERIGSKKQDCSANRLAVANALIAKALRKKEREAQIQDIADADAFFEITLAQTRLLPNQ